MKSNNEPIRVLHVVGAMNYGGVESMLMNLHRNIDHNRVQFDYLVRTNEKGKHDDEILLLGGNIYRIRPFDGLNIYSYYRECLSFFSQHPEIQVVHGHLGSSASLYLKAAKQSGAYTIAHSHNANIDHNFRNLAYSIYSYPTRFVADSLFACSTEAGCSRFGKRAVEGPKFYLFHNAIDLKAYQLEQEERRSVDEEFHFASDNILIGAVGRISMQKNPEFIFRIFKEAIEMNDKVRCIWIGTGDMENKCHALIESHHMADRIIMTGSRNDVPRLLKRMDCYIMPSLFEGLPVSAIEAQATGLPCLLSDAISKETEICDLVKWMSISESPQSWASRAIELAAENRLIRKNPNEEVVKAGYDIKSTSQWLSDFYVSHVK
jgi:glycosyltransferase involved in cell wall biosynthesis